MLYLTSTMIARSISIVAVIVICSNIITAAYAIITVSDLRGLYADSRRADAYAVHTCPLLA